MIASLLKYHSLCKRRSQRLLRLVLIGAAMGTLIGAMMLPSLWAGQAYAQGTIEVYDFDNDAERRRYQTFLDELRCPKCKNNNLAGTNSQIAVDLRRELQRLVREGKTDEEIINFMVARYGDYVLYRPRVRGSTLMLWAGPAIFLLIGAITIGLIVWRRRRFVGRAVDLTPEERQQLQRMLAKNDGKQ